MTAAPASPYARDGVRWPLVALPPAAAVALADRLRPWLDDDGRPGPAVRNNPHLLLRWVADLVRLPAVVDAVAQELGPDLLVLRSVLFVKAAHDPGTVAWHQDGLFWDIGGARVCTAWIALSDSTAANGAVEVAPGSHRDGRRPHALRRDPHGRLLRGQHVPPPDAPTQLVTLRAGEFSLHDVWLVHRSGPNPTAQPRLGLAVRYIATSARPRSVRQFAMLARGADRHGHFPLAPVPQADADPAACRWHRRALRRYACQVALQALSRPDLTHLRLVLDLARRTDLLRAVFGRLPAGDAERGPAPRA